ncbi:Acg family FMN-binding oxidoreductase [Streptomyces regalis]|uniref:Aromatic ring-opening dioxygenase LigA n=1 Tax=Streptomyces regalis TaxID=68262 RepID=A0A124G7U1_9ACTN|nr:aromatic ring-opening dioxygenase LigA [Streptomyces regalis]KUL23652.1 aromatic ring-opening dioxygenase LigA [Streptomyces regalis]
MRTVPLDAATLESCISAAVAAPSIYNTQPWRFRLDPETAALDVHAVPERGLRHVDPVGRALHLSVGAAVFNLRIAAAHFGWTPVVRLLPDPEDPSLLANLRLSGAGRRAPAGHRADLYPMIWRRHSSRVPFSGRPLAPNVRAELGEAAHAEGTLLTFPGAAETARLLRLARVAEHRNRTDPDRAVESRRWVHRDPDDSADLGIPRAALGLQDAHEQFPIRDFTAQRHTERLPAKPFESHPVVALLATEHDRRSDWLRAGQALEHVLLVATAYGVRASLLHQPIEWPDLRRDLSPVPDLTGHAQMLIRLGYGPEGPASPRRAPEQLYDAE